MNEPYQTIADLLDVLCAMGAKKALSMPREQVIKESNDYLRRLIFAWNDYHVLTAD